MIGVGASKMLNRGCYFLVVMAFRDFFKSQETKNEELLTNLGTWATQVSKWTVALNGLPPADRGSGIRSLQAFTRVSNATSAKLRVEPKADVSGDKAEMTVALTEVLEVMKDETSRAQIEVVLAALK